MKIIDLRIIIKAQRVIDFEQAEATRAILNASYFKGEKTDTSSILLVSDWSDNLVLKFIIQINLRILVKNTTGRMFQIFI